MTTGLDEPHAPSTAPSRTRVRRVLVVTNLYPDEARPWFGTFVHTSVLALRRAGVEVDVLRVPGLTGGRAYARGALDALRTNARRPYDVVHAYHGMSGVLGRLQVRAPLVVTFTGSDLLGERGPGGGITPMSRVKLRAYLAAARTSAATITRTPAMAEHLPPRLRARNHVIPHGVDLSRFGRLTRDEARRELGWPLDEPTVIWLARKERPDKDFPLAEAAVDRLRARRPEVRLRAEGHLPPELVPTWMAAADVALLTSRSEGSPNVVKEAMAAELPVVSTPVGDVPDRLAGVPGCAVCAPDPAALAEGLAAALDHGRSPEARVAVSEIALDRMTDRVLGVYESVQRR